MLCRTQKASDFGVLVGSTHHRRIYQKGALKDVAGASSRTRGHIVD